jgi:hypothetical protein
MSIGRQLKDWGKALIASINDRDNSAFNRVALAAIPLPSANAANTTKIPEGVAMDDYIAQVAAASAVPTATNLPLTAFFNSYTSANCYGPQVAFANHDNGTGSPSPLPGGDTGIWLVREGNQTTGTPCSAAELNALLNPVKQRINATFIFGARMKAIAGTTMPSSGSSVDITTTASSFFQTILPTGYTGSISKANIANASGVYTYIIEGSGTSGGITKNIEIKIVHDGTATSTFSGLASYATSSSDGTCLTLSGGTGTKVNVGTVRYSKTSTTAMNLSSREGIYCTTSSLTSTISDYAAVDSSGELDPTKTVCTGTCTGQDAKGWIQGGNGFTRFGATYDPATRDGNYKFAWQAGVGDSNSRMFAMNVSYNSTTLVRTGKAYFGFSGAMNPQSTDATPADLKGMICNWAGPGNSHTPSNLFQYQEITLAGTATDWDITTSKIAYAPTVACNSSATMQFDVNADGTLGATEGNSVTNSLDTLDSGKTTVQATIEGRGFTNPTLY